MSKRRRRVKRAKKIFPAMFNSGRVNVGQSVRSFLTSPKTGEIKGHHPEVFHYRARGGASKVNKEWLDTLFHGKPWSSNEAWRKKMVQAGLNPDVIPTTTREQAQQRAKQLRAAEEKVKPELDLVALYNGEYNADLEQPDWRHQNIERYWRREYYYWVKDCKLCLFFTRSKYFYVEHNSKLNQLRKSFEYSSMQRAKQVYERGMTNCWIEICYLPLNSS